MRLKSIWTAAEVALLASTSLSAWAQGITIKHAFANTPDGAGPIQIVSTNGLFYGSTSLGGTNGEGSVFAFNPNGQVLSTIYSFTNVNGFGCSPNPVLVTASAIYGTAQYAGTNSAGMAYAMNTDGSGFVSIRDFGSGLDGAYPGGGLVLIGSSLYGTTMNGGTNGLGTVFKVNTDGSQYQILHSFTNNPDGSTPQCELLLANGRFYGTTTYGGTNGTGTVFAVNPDGSGYSLLYNFSNSPDAAYPKSGLALAGAVLYGTASFGGTNITGAIFAINTNGSGYRVLHSFAPLSNNSEGSVPLTSLTFSGNSLYGCATANGINSGGTLFIINTNGSGFTVIESFTNSDATGWDPLCRPIRVGNNLWGTAHQGTASVLGTIYSLALPAVISEPQNLTVTNTSPATFTVNAADDQQISYKWYFNTNTLLAGQTTNVLTLASATNNNAGTYTAVLSDSLGSITSSPAVLTVIVPGIPPTITNQPQSITVLVSNTASFTNAASGTPPLYYQWYFNTNTLLSAQTNAILTIPQATTNLAGYYTVIVTNLYGSVTSTPALLTVNVGTKPTITRSPQNFTVTNGLTATFTNLASGTEPLFYGWYFNTNTFVSGGLDQTILTVNPATTNQAGYYLAIVTNLYGKATSAPALLTVIVPPSKPGFTQQPQNTTVTNGYNAAFTNAVTGTLPVHYQWYFNTNTLLAGGTNAILTVAFVTTNQAGYYTVVVTNIAGSVTSSPALLTVISTKPIVIIQPVPATANSGTPFSFTVVVGGLPPLRYQWYTNVVFFTTAQAGQTNSVYTNSFATNTLSAFYMAVITNTLGKTTSSAAFLTVLTKPVFSLQPSNTTVINGNPASFAALASGPGVLGYQWYFRTNTGVLGATGTTLVFTNAITNLAGFYDVRVTNSFGAATSSFALLTISNVPNLLSFAFTNGSASFAFAYTPKATNRLWVSTNLSSVWRVLLTNVMATNGLWNYTDTNTSATNPIRFYRFSSP